MVNALTRHTGITLGPIVLETLVKHYFERVAKENENEETTRLRKEELLYDEAFHIVKVSNTSVVVHDALMTNIELLKGVPGGRFSVSATSTSSLCTYSFTTLATP